MILSVFAVRIAGLLLCVMSCYALALAAPAHAQPRRDSERASGRALTVAVMVDGPSEAYLGLARRITTELRGVFGQDVRLQLLPASRVQGDFTRAVSNTQLAEVMADPNVDLLVPLGPLLTMAVLAQPRLTRPVILPLVFEPAMMGLPREGNRSAYENLNYIGGLDSLARDMGWLSEIVGPRKQVVVIDRQVADLLEGLDTQVQGIARRLGLQAQVLPVDADAASILQAIPNDAGAVLLLGLPRMAGQGLGRLLDGLRDRRLPTFSSMGPAWLERGVMATATPREDWVRRARRVALHAQRIVLGERAEDLPVLFEPRETLRIHMGVAREIGVSPSFAIQTEALLIDPGDGHMQQALSLPQVVAAAAARNRNLDAARARVAAGKEDANAARGPLLPQVGLSALATQLDPDVASSLGPAERTASWTLSARQLIYSPAAWGHLGAQRQVARSLDQELREQALDLKLMASQAYIAVLRAQTSERINRDNVQRTRAHLELAEVRAAIGVGRKSEVYRWQSELATAQRQVILTVASRNQAQIALNRLLHEPLERPFLLTDLRPGSSGRGVAMVLDPRVEPYVDDPASFRVFRAFMVQEAESRAPELARLDHLIAANEAGLGAQRRALWLPTAALVGGITHNFWIAGRGRKTTQALDIGGMQVEFAGPPRDRLTWKVGVEASMPLFEGTARYAKIRQRQQELLALQRTRVATREIIEQRVRSTLHQAGASRPGIGLTQRASDAASRNLELVRDAYRAGAVSVISLLDAQSQALSAELAAADAYYSFMLDFLAAQRAVGQFSFELPSTERDAFFARLLRFTQERGDYGEIRAGRMPSVSTGPSGGDAPITQHRRAAVRSPAHLPPSRPSTGKARLQAQTPGAAQPAPAMQEIRP